MIKMILVITTIMLMITRQDYSEYIRENKNYDGDETDDNARLGR